MQVCPLRHYTEREAAVYVWRRLILCAMFLCCIAGCERTQAPVAPRSSEAAQTPEASAPAKPSQSVEAKGQVVARSAQLPVKPERIISLAPNLTEALFALGLGDRVVGVTRFCDYPEQAKSVTKIGGFIDPDLEKMISLRPDLIVGMSSGQDPALATKLKAQQLPYAFLKMDDLSQTKQGLLDLGELVGAQHQAQALVADMERALVAAQVKAPKPRVMFVIGHKPLMVAGPGSFGHELLTLAGGANVAQGLSSPYPALELEQAIELNPQVIIDAAMAPGQAQGSFWQAYDTLEAVKTKRVYVLEDASLLRPGPRLGLALEKMRAMIQAGAQ